MESAGGVDLMKKRRCKKKMSFKIFGVLDAYESRNTEEKMVIFLSEDYGCVHIKAYPIREDDDGTLDFKFDAFHTLDEEFDEMSFNDGIRYLRELFPNMFEVQDENEILERIKKR